MRSSAFIVLVVNCMLHMVPRVNTGTAWIPPQFISLFQADTGKTHSIPVLSHAKPKNGPSGGNNAEKLDAAQRAESRTVCDCGVQQYVPHRIIGGFETFPNEYPWMAALVFPPGSVSCGASLISNRFALSAAHCFLFPVATIYVLLGAHDLRTISANAVAVPVRQIVVHPNFNRTSGDYDLAIVEFDFPINYGPNVSPICLPFPNVDLTWHSVVVMGWGLTQFVASSFTLQEVTLTVAPNEICQQQYGASNPITERMICAWGNGKDACRGDSGGPLIWNFGGRWFVVGIVSFGMECGTSTSAGVYTRVDRFVDWIISETEDAACLAPAAVVTTVAYPWLVSRSTTTGSTSAATRASSPIIRAAHRILD